MQALRAILRRSTAGSSNTRQFDTRNRFDFDQSTIVR
jgi:hypothetical protein